MRAYYEFLSKSWLHKVVGGAPIMLLILGLIAGIDGMFGILIMTIVCTAGIGLIFWGLLAFVSGLVAYQILKSYYGELPGRSGETGHGGQPKRAIVVTDPDMASIVNYILDAKVYGFTDSEIDARLANAGWSTDQISKARTFFSN